MVAQFTAGIRGVAASVRGWAAIGPLLQLMWAEVRANKWLFLIAALMVIAGRVMATDGLAAFELKYPSAEHGKATASLVVCGICIVAALLALTNLTIVAADRVFPALKLPLIPVRPTANLEKFLRTIAPIGLGMFISLTVFR